MSNKFQNLIEKVQEFRENWKPLSGNDKTALKKSVMEYVEMKPVRNSPEGTYGYKGFKMSLLARFTVPALTLVVLFGGVGVSAAAEGSLPGDFLYAVKVSFNEKIRGAFAASDGTKESWEIRKVERRFEEINKLAQRNKLTEKNKGIVEKQLEEALKNVEDTAQRFNAKGERDLAQNLYIEAFAILKNNEHLVEGKIAKINLEKSRGQERGLEEASMMLLQNPDMGHGGDTVEEGEGTDETETSIMATSEDEEENGQTTDNGRGEDSETNIFRGSRTEKDRKKSGVLRINIARGESIEARARIAKLEKRIETIENNSNINLDGEIIKKINKQLKEVGALIDSGQFIEALKLLSEINENLDNFLIADMPQREKVETEKQELEVESTIGL